MSRYRLNNRHGLDGWALIVKGSAAPIPSTLCTTRREARTERDGWRKRGMLRGVTVLVVPVRMHLEVVSARGRRGKAQPTRPLALSEATE